jgi:inositol-phosphate phosphatase/L-galactose 1-phosphate phosphatase/histidinol-phosphatase
MINQELINFSNHLADLSQEIAKRYFRLPNGETSKEDETPVTHADREIEKIIRSEIEKKFPDHGIIGEEFGEKKTASDFTWILDPIDGTSSFIVGRPIFGTLIALSFRKKVVIGVMNQPIAGERWIGIDDDSKNSGAWLNGKKIQTRKCNELNNAVLSACSPFFFKDGDEKIFEKITRLTKYQKIGGVIYGGDCYSYACLASGFIDLIIDPGLKVYDYAALLPIIRMAGGVVTDWQGNDPQLQSNVKLVAAGDKKLHQQILEILK